MLPVNWFTLHCRALGDCISRPAGFWLETASRTWEEPQPSQSSTVRPAPTRERNLAGDSDLFLLALPPDGSSPHFMTAIGGSGWEGLSGMVFTADGNLLVTGTTTSSDLPRTADAWPLDAPTAQAPTVVVVRLDPFGARLIYSTFLGTPDVTGVTAIEGGDYALTGSGTLPELITSAVPSYSVPALRTRSAGFMARFSGATNQALWASVVQTRTRNLASN